MKNTSKKGFTLVELVIVIAVIAILAGVLIGTFASVINRANKSAEIQKVKSEELAVKAEDILKKIEDSNWYGWADFENSIVEKISKEFKDSASASSFDSEKLKTAVKEALVEYGVNAGNDYSALTGEQVKAIVENALGTLKYEGVTEDQVRAIVNAAVNNAYANQITAAQVRAIVNAANTNGLTSTQVANIVANALASTTADLEDAIEAAVLALKGDISGIVTLTEDDVIDIITNLVPVTKTATVADNTENTGFNYLVAQLISGSTIKIGSELSTASLELSTTLNKTLCIRADVPFTGTLTINAPNATIYLVGDFSDAEVTVEETANNSLHVNGKVGTLTLNKGRTVVESGSTIGTLIAIPSKESTVKVVIEESAKVNDLYAQYQDHGNKEDDSNQRSADFIEIENNGTVVNSVITASAALADSGNTTTNVKITNGPNAKGTNVSNVEVPATIAEDLEEIVGYALPVAEAQATLEVNENGAETDPVGYVITTGDEGTVIKEAKDCSVLGHDNLVLVNYQGVNVKVESIWCRRCHKPIAFVNQIDDNFDAGGYTMDVSFSFKAFSDKEIEITVGDQVVSGSVYDIMCNGENPLINSVDFNSLNNNKPELLSIILPLAGVTVDGENIVDTGVLPYLNWDCDFYVHFNKNTKLNSFVLGGQYDSYSQSALAVEPWNFITDKETIEAGEVLPLLGTAINVIFGGKENMTEEWKDLLCYKGIIQLVKEFNCGFKNLSEDNVGKTFTVELRMTNPNDSNDYKTICTIDYLIDSVD